MAAVDSKKAAAYILDPLTAPEPSAETGPGSSFRPPTASSTHSRAPSSSSQTNPYRKSGHRASHSRNISNGSQPERFPDYRQATFGQLNDGPSGHNRRASADESRRRSSSLKERFPGDESHKPLDIIRRDSKKANRSPHLNKRNMPGTDSIDRLDPTIGSAYHHEGPYDAASLARNRKPGHGPVHALRDSNAEALRATPVENVKNAVDRHVPLDGVAQVPPGETDRFGRRYRYEEGENLMIDNDPPGGAYKRYPGVEYHPDDIKGKGEPSYSQDRALHGHSVPVDRRNEGATELVETDRRHQARDAELDAAGERNAGRRKSSLTQGLKKRLPHIGGKSTEQ